MKLFWGYQPVTTMASKNVFDQFFDNALYGLAKQINIIATHIHNSLPKKRIEAAPDHESL